MNIDLPPDILTYALLMIALIAVYHHMIIMPMFKKLQENIKKNQDNIKKHHENFTVSEPIRSHSKPKERVVPKRRVIYEDDYSYEQVAKPVRRRNKYRYNDTIPNKNQDRPIQKKKPALASNVNPNNIDTRYLSCRSTVESLDNKVTEEPKYNCYEFVDRRDEDFNMQCDSFREAQQEYDRPVTRVPRKSIRENRVHVYSESESDEDY